jgi:ribonuclease BN (tRNA processing enzyme)
MPGPSRQTTCLALRYEDQLVLFDAGTGIARLAQPGYARLLAGHAPVHLFLSHLHLDHSVGLSYLPGLWKARSTVLHIPRAVLAEREGALDHLLSAPFFPVALPDFPMPVEVRALDPGSVDLGGLRVRVRYQTHPGSSAGFRVADEFAFLTDTVFDPESVDFVRGVRILVHEAWIKGEGDPPDLQRTLRSHTAAPDAASIAAEAQVGELILTHLNPLRDAGYHEEMLERARRVFAHTNLAYDGLTRLF